MRIFNRRGLAVLAAAGAGVAPVLIVTGASGADTTTTTTSASPSTLTVVGDGSVEVTPDLASVDVTVLRSASTSRVALSEANARTDLIVKAIEGTGVPATGIQTTNVSTTNTTHKVGPAGHRHLLRQFTAEEDLTISMTSHLAGPVIDAATRTGASSVNNLDFSFSNPDAGVSEANAAAITSARTQADTAAADIGYVVTGVQSINLDPGESTTAPQTDEGTAGSSAGTTSSGGTPTDVNPGQQEVDASVQIVYYIAPASS